jgi:peptidylprolyl isomerase
VEAIEALVALHGEGYRFELHEVDIESEELLFKRFLEKIPVVEVDGEVVSELILEEAAVRAKLEGRAAAGMQHAQALTRRILQMKFFGLIVILCMSLALAACGEDSSSGKPGAAQSTNSGRSGSAQPSGSEEIEVVQASPSEESANAKLTKPDVEFPSGPPPKKLIVKDLREGSGPPAKTGDKLTAEFLAVDETGKLRYSSWSHQGLATAKFQLGKGQYFPGWDKGIEDMRAGGRREMIFPAKLTGGLGALAYVVDLLKIE